MLTHKTEAEGLIHFNKMILCVRRAFLLISFLENLVFKFDISKLEIPENSFIIVDVWWTHPYLHSVSEYEGNT